MEIFIALLITALLIGVPTFFIVRLFKKVDCDDTIYTPEEIAQRLKKGYSLSIWGVEMAFGSVALFILMACKIPVALMFAFPIGYCTVGLILLMIGMVIVGTGTRYLNRGMRELTPLEQWTLSASNRLQSHAQQKHLANSITRMTPGVTDDMLAAIGSAGVVHGLFAIASIYVGKNKLKKHWPVFSILLILGICILVSIV